MTPCPRCGRPEPTAELEAHAGGCECEDCLAACWSRWGHRDMCDHRRDELLAMVRDLGPDLLREVHRVLVHGAAKYGAAGVGETGGGQTAEDHAAHAFLHAMSVDRDVMNRDAETGALEAVHAIGRLWLAARMAGGAGGGVR